MRATQVTKPGAKGGDVRFTKVAVDLSNHLKQRTDTYVTTFVDYYGTKEWPGLELLQGGNHEPETIAEQLNSAAMEKMIELLPSNRVEQRFIPFVAIHEFESLLFSDADVLAAELSVQPDLINRILEDCGGPEKINNSLQTAPSKRLDHLNPQIPFKKTTNGITIAEKIGIAKMRESCILFDEWLSKLESLQKQHPN